MLSRKWKVNFHLQVRCLSLSFNSCQHSSSKPSCLPPFSVLRSTSDCPYENLAFEDFIYETEPFAGERRVLFLWRNRPCVVIGRHQNPWKEVNLPLLKSRGVSLCRRKSGGGTVYHDKGNINLTFFTGREKYDRKKNLQFIIDCLQRQPSLRGHTVEYSARDDILLDERYKVSGSAAKLGLRTAYHHCTLLCNVDLTSLAGILRTPFGESIETNATESHSSPTANLFPNGFHWNTITQDFCDAFLQKEFPICDINPVNFATVEERVAELKSLEWRFHKSPKFSVQKTWFVHGTSLQVTVDVVKGKLKKIEIETDLSLAWLSDVSDMFVGESFGTDVIPVLIRNSTYMSCPVFDDLVQWIFKW